jgi:hypothetical protein
MKVQNRVLSKEQFDAGLAAAGRAIRRQRGECPDTEALGRFFASGLSKAEAERIRAHIAGCGVCDLLVEKMKAFEADVSASHDFAPSATAYAVERRILESLKRAKPGQIAGQPKTATSVVQRLRYVADLTFWCLRRPAFAYAMILALAYPAYRGLRPRVQVPPAPLSRAEAPETPSPRPPMVAAALDLQAPQRGNGGPSQVIELAPADSVLVLSFFLPTQKGFSYRAELTNDMRQPVGMPVQLVPNPVAYFTLVYDRKLFGPGKYTLRLFKTPADVLEVGSPAMEYAFWVKVETGAAPRRSGSG